MANRTSEQLRKLMAKLSQQDIQALMELLPSELNERELRRLKREEKRKAEERRAEERKAEERAAINRLAMGIIETMSLPIREAIGSVAVNGTKAEAFKMLKAVIVPTSVKAYHRVLQLCIHEYYITIPPRTRIIKIDNGKVNVLCKGSG